MSFMSYVSKNFLHDKLHVNFCRYLLGINKKSMIVPTTAVQVTIAETRQLNYKYISSTTAIVTWTACMF